MSAAEWKVVASSVQGASHRRVGLPCQDAHRWRLLPGGALVAAVADGAGSASHAEIGAACAAEAAVVALSARYDARTDRWAIRDEATLRELLRHTLLTARAAVEAAAQDHDVTPRDLATTLIVALTTGDWIAAAQVGDGAVVTAGAGGDLNALTAPPAAEYANETIFLTSPDALDTAQIAFRWEPVAQVAIFSDGLQRLALRLPEGAPHGPFFAPLLRFAAGTEDGDTAREQLTAFLMSPRIAERADDDLTLLLATLQNGA